MPKSKVRKKPAQAASRAAAARAAASAPPAKVAGPSSPLYIGIMLGLMIFGLLWIVVFYLSKDAIPLMNQLGNWNLVVGFAFMIVGLLMTMRWR